MWVGLLFKLYPLLTAQESSSVWTEDERGRVQGLLRVVTIISAVSETSSPLDVLWLGSFLQSSMDTSPSYPVDRLFVQRFFMCAFNGNC